MWVAMRARSTSNVVLELPISLFIIYVRVCNLEEFADGLGPLVVMFGMQLLMMMESSGESEDGSLSPMLWMVFLVRVG